ncbi:MAG: hypothetical protein JJE52_13555 [Acidimicrobiia bacterium]|nr:hypothetical protein [Acidimicrobiia bacterium]
MTDGREINSAFGRFEESVALHTSLAEIFRDDFSAFSDVALRVAEASGVNATISDYAASIARVAAPLIDIRDAASILEEPIAASMGDVLRSANVAGYVPQNLGFSPKVANPEAWATANYRLDDALAGMRTRQEEMEAVGRTPVFDDPGDWAAAPVRVPVVRDERPDRMVDALVEVQVLMTAMVGHGAATHEALVALRDQGARDAVSTRRFSWAQITIGACTLLLTGAGIAIAAQWLS